MVSIRDTGKMRGAGGTAQAQEVGRSPVYLKKRYREQGEQMRVTGSRQAVRKQREEKMKLQERKKIRRM